MYYFIVNPSAASGKGAKVWREVEQILQEEKIEYERPVFRGADEMIAYVRKLTTAPCHIVVLGGDGTLNDVLQGISDFAVTKLSCIRMGSGNDFARDMELTKDVKKGLHNILHEGTEQVLDYGEITYEAEGEKVKKRFLISSGVGYDADICVEVEKSNLKERLNRIHLGKLVYVMVGVKQIFTRKCVPATVTMYRDGDASKVEKAGNLEKRKIKKKVISVDSLFFAVGMQHVFEGGGIPFCPKANPRDGMLDVCIVRNMPKWKLLLAVALVYIKQHILFRAVTIHRCNRMVIETEEPQWFHMDGDTFCQVKRIELCSRQGIRFVS